MKKSVIRAHTSAMHFEHAITPDLKLPLSMPQLDILFTVAASEKNLHPSELAAHLDTTRPQVAKQLAVLMKHDYLDKIPDKHDGRRFTVSLSARGESLVTGGVAKQYYGPIMYASEHMGKKRFNKFVRMLEEFTEATKHE